MERDIKVIYRVAEKANKNPKGKPEWINNVNCLNSIVWQKGLDIKVFGDRLDKTAKYLKKKGVKYTPTKAHGNAETFIEALDYALSLDDEQIVYFVEDDYVHLEGIAEIIKEGLGKVDFISLYDHPDKYNGTRKLLFHTESTHWQVVESTTMTFACRVKTLRETQDIFRAYSITGNPADHLIFVNLGAKGYRLATPIPGWATHGETEWLAPVINWEDRANE